MANIEIRGLKELLAAVARSPDNVVAEAQIYFQRGMSAYRRSIQNNPWRVGATGGGSPVAIKHGGSLRDSHQTRYEKFMASIGPNRNGTSPYAKFVHFGTYKMRARPWLDYAKQQNQSEIEKLYREFLTNIVKDLAR